MVSLEGLYSKLKEIKSKHNLPKKPQASSNEYLDYMKKKVELNIEIYSAVLELYPDIDKFTMRNI